MKAILPTRALAVFLAIGFLDLVMTAVLHANGLIVELNPLMRPLIEHSEWAFAAVKGATLVAAWAAMAWYGRQNAQFVRAACAAGSGAYLFIWSAWFLVGHYTS